MTNYQKEAPCCLLLLPYGNIFEKVTLQSQSSRHCHWRSLCCQERTYPPSPPVPQWPWETDNWMCLSNIYDPRKFGLPSFLPVCSCHRRDPFSPDLMMPGLSASQPCCKLRLFAIGNDKWHFWQCLIWAVFGVQTSPGCLKVSEFYQEFDSEV